MTASSVEDFWDARAERTARQNTRLIGSASKMTKELSTVAAATITSLGDAFGHKGRRLSMALDSDRKSVKVAIGDSDVDGVFMRVHAEDLIQALRLIEAAYG